MLPGIQSETDLADLAIKTWQNFLPVDPPNNQKIKILKK